MDLRPQYIYKACEAEKETPIHLKTDCLGFEKIAFRFMGLEQANDGGTQTVAQDSTHHLGPEWPLDSAGLPPRGRIYLFAPHVKERISHPGVCSPLFISESKQIH